MIKVAHSGRTEKIMVFIHSVFYDLGDHLLVT